MSRRLVLGTPGVRERLLAQIADISDGQVIFGEYLLEVPLARSIHRTSAEQESNGE